MIKHTRHLYYRNENYHLYEYYSTIRWERYRLLDWDFWQYVNGKITEEQIKKYNPNSHLFTLSKPWN